MIALALAITVVACDSVRVCAGGDVTLGTNIDTVWGRVSTGIKKGDWRAKLVPADSLLAPLRPLVAGADLVLVNAEGAFGDEPTHEDKCSLRFAQRRPLHAVHGQPNAHGQLKGHVPLKGHGQLKGHGPLKGHAQLKAYAQPADTAVHQHCFALRQPAAAAGALRRLGDTTTVVVANVANNHAHDAGPTGFAHSLALLRAAGVVVTGADTVPTVVATPRGDTVALLGFSAWSSPGVADLSAVERLVAAARSRYGRVIVTAHMGAEGVLAQRTGDSTEHYLGEDRGNPVAFAHTALAAGASMVIGHGPHVLRAAEWRDSALVFYSLGNLVNYGPFALAEPARRGAVVCATLDSAGPPRDVVVRATVQPAQGIVGADSTGRALQLLDSLSRLDFPSTGATVDSLTGVVRPFTDSTSSNRRE